jgi:hypothetical protein
MKANSPEHMAKMQAAAAAKRALQLASGDPVPKPPPRAKLLKRYFQDLEGVFDCRGNVRLSSSGQSIIECRRIARERYKAAVGEPAAPARAIKAICFECVGGGADDGPKLAIRDCRVLTCPLHPVRPWQNAKNRNKPPQ